MTEALVNEFVDAVLTLHGAQGEIQKRLAAEKAVKEKPDELPPNWQKLSPAQKIELGIRRSTPARNPANEAHGLAGH